MNEPVSICLILKIICIFRKKAYICIGFTEKMGRLRKKAFFRTVNQDKNIWSLEKELKNY